MSTPGPVDSNQFVMSVGATLSPDGQVAQINVARANGETVELPFPVAAAGSIVLTIEEALGTMFERQRSRLKGQDPQAVYPIGAKKIQKIQGSIAQGGIPVLSLALVTGLRLDFSLDQTAIPDLIGWLQGLEAARKTPQRLEH
jgi:hypothetical protein